MDHLPRKIVSGPGEILDFGDEFRPVDAAQHEGRSKAAVPRRRHRERHLGGRVWLQPAPQSRQLRLFDIGAGAAGIDKASLGIVVGDQQRAEIGPASFGIGPADHEGKSEPQQFCGFHEPGEVPSGLDSGLILDSLSRPALSIK